jgi:hypothetical protein
MKLTQSRKISSSTDSVLDNYDFIALGSDFEYDLASIYKLFDSNYESRMPHGIWSLKFGGKLLKSNSKYVI